jgi:hypothetical protein
VGITVSRASAATVSFSTPQEIIISHADDSIKVGDGADFLAINSDGSINAVSAPSVLATLIDEASATVTYIGKAAIATATSASSWQISKLTVSGSITSITWADGNATYDNVWDNRASLTYT